MFFRDYIWLSFLSIVATKKSRWYVPVAYNAVHRCNQDWLVPVCDCRQHPSRHAIRDDGRQHTESELNGIQAQRRPDWKNSAITHKRSLYMFATTKLSLAVPVRLPRLLLVYLGENHQHRRQSGKIRQSRLQDPSRTCRHLQTLFHLVMIIRQRRRSQE